MCFADRLAVKYAFQVNEGVDVRTDLVVEPFNAVNEQNDYEVRLLVLCIPCHVFPTNIRTTSSDFSVPLFPFWTLCSYMRAVSSSASFVLLCSRFRGPCAT